MAGPPTGQGPANPPPPLSFDEFRRFVTSVWDLRSFLVKGATAAPLFDLFVGFGPPVLTRTILAAVTLVLELIIYLAAFGFLSRTDPDRVKSRFHTTVVVAIALMIGYLALFLSFTCPAPDQDHRVVVGWQIRDDPVIRAEAEKPGITNADLVAIGGNDPRKVWTEFSVSAMEFFLLAVWLSLFLCVAFLFTAQVLITRPSGGPP